MVITEVKCMCPDGCGNTFKISDETMERAVAYEDVLISLVCPNIDLNNVAIIEKLDGFAIVSKLETPS